MSRSGLSEEPDGSEDLSAGPVLQYRAGAFYSQPGISGLWFLTGAAQSGGAVNCNLTDIDAGIVIKTCCTKYEKYDTLAIDQPELS